MWIKLSKETEPALSIEILMPALSPTMEEGVLAKWLVKVGDMVKSGDVLAEIETDKATMEVETIDEGVIEALLVAAGTQNVRVNTPIALIGDGSGAGAVAPAPAAPVAAAEVAKQPKAAKPEPVALPPAPVTVVEAPVAVNGMVRVTLRDALRDAMAEEKIGRASCRERV